MGDAKRALKTGLAHVTEQKMEQNYDREEAAGTPAACANWINGVLGDELSEKCPPGDWKAMNTFLRDGVVLCKLINKLLKADGKNAISFQKKVMSPFVAMTNIEEFNKACKAYGLAQEFTFQSGDLWELRKAGFYNVINGLHSLGFVANSKSFMPMYQGEVTKTIDRE